MPEHTDRDANAGAARSFVRTISRQAASSASRATGPEGALYRTMSDGFSRSVELAVTPVIFGAAGFGIDHWRGTLPVFTIILALLALVGLLLRTWYGYVYRMEQLESAQPWAAKAKADAA